MARRRYAKFDSDKECTKHSPCWTGNMPCTGQFVCRLCGSYIDPETRVVVLDGDSEEAERIRDRQMGRVVA